MTGVPRRHIGAGRSRRVPISLPAPDRPLHGVARVFTSPQPIRAAETPPSMLELFTSTKVPPYNASLKARQSFRSMLTTWRLLTACVQSDNGPSQRTQPQHTNAQAAPGWRPARPARAAPLPRPQPRTPISHTPADMPPKQDFPPLLSDGLHQCTINDITLQCVDVFPLSTSRPQLLVGLRAVVQILSTAGIRGELWIDGSFVTQKLNPGDIDVVLYISGDQELTDIQWQHIASFTSVDFRTQVLDDYGCDFYFILERDILDTYWRKQYGRDRSGRPKGIMVLSINGGEA